MHLDFIFGMFTVIAIFGIRDYLAGRREKTDVRT